MGWIVSIPVNAKGYIILDMGDYELKDCSDIKFAPEWNWNGNTYGKTVTFSQFGYIAPAQPDEPDEPDVTVDAPRGLCYGRRGGTGSAAGRIRRLAGRLSEQCLF